MNSRILHVLDYVYYTLVVSVAVVGNTLVMISVVKFHSLRCNANYLIVALAISDLLMACTWPVILGINEWNRSLFIENYRSWEIACKIAATVQVFAIVGDFLSIFLITVDRFVYINFPLRYEVYVTKRRIFVILCITFIFATPFAAIKVWLPDRLNYGHDCSLWTLLDPFLMNLMWTPLFTILTLVILSVYIKVANLAYESKRRIHSQQINMESGAIAIGINKSQNKTTKTLLLVLGIFTSTYTLWLIIYYLTVNTYSETVELVQTVVDWLWQTNIWVNPLIYAYKNRNFQIAFRRLLHLSNQVQTEHRTSVTQNSLQ